jgi:hypothetical protein
MSIGVIMMGVKSQAIIVISNRTVLYYKCVEMDSRFENEKSSAKPLNSHSRSIYFAREISDRMTSVPAGVIDRLQATSYCYI